MESSAGEPSSMCCLLFAALVLGTHCNALQRTATHCNTLQANPPPCAVWLCRSYHEESTIRRLLKMIGLAEYRLFYRALLQKRPIILSLLIVATP